MHPLGFLKALSLSRSLAPALSEGSHATSSLSTIMRPRACIRSGSGLSLIDSTDGPGRHKCSAFVPAQCVDVYGGSA
ncbi:hypothetical protein BD779DRAFT_433360 [Infundibulicybe gibba]|nr:hypothetical protein BD779DRAFT_433360 [Infundibulicybe gibba]